MARVEVRKGFLYFLPIHKNQEKLKIKNPRIFNIKYFGGRLYRLEGIISK